jgi:endonuclease/exonuclease/phosphatase (EEP) superfamily protein YafD
VAEGLATSYADIHGSVIFGGDFNARPGEAVIQRLVNAGLRDALSEAPSKANHCNGNDTRIDMVLYKAAHQNALGITRVVSYQGECSPGDVTDHPVIKVEFEGVSIKS